METYQVIEAGVYRAKLETIHSIDTKFGKALKFTWRIIGSDSDGETFNALANKRLMPKSKLATWAKAHLGMNAFPEGFVLTLSSLIGKEVYITLATEARSDGMGERNTVQAVSPFRPVTKKAKPQGPAGAFSEAFEDEIPDPGEPMRAGERRVEA